MSEKSYFRKNIDKMSGYVPGKQIAGKNIIKINTNENPYPPSPNVAKALKLFDIEQLRQYPNPRCCELCNIIGDLHNISENCVIAGNGSDDILTMALRSFVGEGEIASCVTPTYSLYSILADIQGATCAEIELNSDFSLPDNILAQIANSKLFLLPRPNAPTGTSFEMNKIKNICEKFKGIVLIDEAYADFANDNCMSLVKEFDNVIVTRTLSKSYSLAGSRFGYAVANENLINGMLKVKDSYNVNTLTQIIAKEALLDQNYFKNNVLKIKETKAYFLSELDKLNFSFLPSLTNFVFVKPPDENGEKMFNFLLENNILTRFFSGNRTNKFVRVSIGTMNDMKNTINILKKY